MSLFCSCNDCRTHSAKKLIWQFSCPIAQNVYRYEESISFALAIFVLRRDVYTGLVPKGLLFLGGILGGDKSQPIPGVPAIKVARGACGTDTPPFVEFLVLGMCLLLCGDTRQWQATIGVSVLAIIAASWRRRFNQPAIATGHIIIFGAQQLHSVNIFACDKR